MAAQNVLDGDVSLAQWDEVALLDPARRFCSMCAASRRTHQGFIPGSTHIPLDDFARVWMNLPATAKSSCLAKAASVPISPAAFCAERIPRAQSDRILAHLENRLPGGK